MRPRYGVLIKADADSLATNVDIEDAEYIFLGAGLPLEKGREFIQKAIEENPEIKGWKDVKIVYPTKTAGTIYIWVRAHILTEKTALASGKSLEQSIETYYRSQVVDILEEEFDEKYINPLLKVHDVGLAAMKKEFRKQFGTDEDIKFTDGEEREEAKDIDDILNEIEEGLDDDGE